MQGIKVKSKKHTYADYLQLDDDKRYEIIDGELIMVPSPYTRHQIISQNLNMEVYKFVIENNLGYVIAAPMDVYLDEFNVVQPDILFISNKRKSIITERCIKGAPDLVIEILSESSLQKDRIDKKELYERFGVREYWIVDPLYKIVEIYILKSKAFILYKTFSQNDVLSSKLLKGLKVNLNRVFES